MQPTEPERCAVCHQKAFGFNYELVTCNACKMFFRRAMIEGVNGVCKQEGSCFDGDDLSNTRPRCRACRFKKCKNLGMRYNPSPEMSEDEHLALDLRKLKVTEAEIEARKFMELRYLNQIRRDIYGFINVVDNPSFADLVIADCLLGAYQRPVEVIWEETERMMKPWGSLGILLIVEIIKTWDFYKQLLLSDRIILLKNAAFKSHHLCVGYDSYLAKKDRMFAPNGDEMFPQVLFQISKCRNAIMAYLKNPLKHLQILNLSEDEFLLVNMIFICSPTLHGLSQNAQDILGARQREFSMLLLKMCLRDHPSNGPGRYVEILSIEGCLIKQKRYTTDLISVLKTNWAPAFSCSNVMSESLAEQRTLQSMLL